MLQKSHAPTSVPGFSPLVEAATNGAQLKLLHDQRLVIPWQARCELILACGKTGSGKTTGLILPFCFADIEDPKRTIVFLDAQASEVRRIIEHTRRVRGENARVIYINPQDPDYSASWNPFAKLFKRFEAFSVAHTMSAAVKMGRQETSYFRNQATKFLAAKILGLNSLNHGNATGGELLHLLDSGPAVLAEFARKAGLTDLAVLASNLASANHNDQTTLSELSNLLLPWNDDKVEEVTSASDFNFDTLDEEPTVLLYAVPEESVGRLRPLTNAFLHRFFHWVMERSRQNGDSLNRPITLFMDEFASAIGEIPFFPDLANTIRKRGLAIFAAVQTLAQIHDVYGPSARSLIAAFNHHIYVPPVDWEDALYASERSNRMMVEHCVTSDGYTPLSFHTSERAVLLPDEIANPSYIPALGGPRMTFFLKGTPPFQGWLRPVYQRPEYRETLENAGSLPFPLPKQERPRRSPERPAISPQLGVAFRLEDLEEKIDLPNTTGSAKRWWADLPRDGDLRHFAEDLVLRKATITEAFLVAHVYAKCGNDFKKIVLFLNDSRIKEENERKRREGK